MLDFKKENIENLDILKEKIESICLLNGILLQLVFKYGTWVSSN
jgi:hypothetical protein